MAARGRWRRVRVAAVMVAGTLALAACGDDSDDGQASTAEPRVTTTAAPTSTVPVVATTLKAALSGQTEVPKAGDPAGSGTATVNVDPVKNEVCYQLTVSGIAPAERAHIHSGAPGEYGPVLVTFTPPTTGTSEGCTSADPGLIQRMIQDPGGYYVNVHNDPYPFGAIRGQLTR